MMKTTRHSLIAKGLMVLLALAVMVFAFTYSWYTPVNPEADATGATFALGAAGDFEYSIGFYNNGTGGTYKTTDFTSDSTQLNLEALRVYDGTAQDNDGYDSATGRYYHTYNLLHDFSPIDVTGDGRTLIRPAMSYGNKEIVTSSNDYSIAEPNVQYISFDLYFRSNVYGVPIKLGAGSWAKGKCEIDSGSATSYAGSSAANKSTFGDFSKDAIVGAVRIAFVPYSYSLQADNIPSTLGEYQDDTPDYLAEHASLLWLPKPELLLTETSGSYTLSTGANEATHQYYGIFETGHPHQIKTYSNTITTSMITTMNREFARIDNTVHIGDYYYTKVNVRIWIEGTDAEARRATSGGKFGVNFKLTTNE